MQCKITFVMSFAILICACNNNATTQNLETQDTKIEIQQKSPVSIRVGEVVSLDEIKNISTFDNELKKVSTVGDCGGFLAQEEGDDENIYQYGNMAINIMGNQAVISKVIEFSDNFKFNYKGLVVDNNFTPKDLRYNEFEIFEDTPRSSQDIIGIESTNIKTIYDNMYSLRENDSDDLFYLYFLRNKAVALEIIVQC